MNNNSRFNRNLKNKSFELKDIIRFIREQPNYRESYEIDGVVEQHSNRNGRKILFRVKQKGIVNASRRQYIPEPTSADINFHTHPGFQIWPSLEDLVNTLSITKKQTNVIVTWYGVWVMHKNITGKITNEQFHNMRAIYDTVNNTMVHYYNYTYEKFLSNGQSPPFDENILLTLRFFETELKKMASLTVTFYPTSGYNLNVNNQFVSKMQKRFASVNLNASYTRSRNAQSSEYNRDLF